MVVNVEGENMRVDNLPIDSDATSAGGSARIVNPGQYGHPGSWWGLPENGLTEMITGWINPSAAHASEGLGSDFFPNATADANNNNDPTTPPPTTPPDFCNIKNRNWHFRLVMCTKYEFCFFQATY